MKKIVKTILFILMFTFVLSACQSNESDNGKIKVYTSFYAMYDFTKTIAGDDAEVICITPVGSEPHDFELTASLMAKLSNADVFIYSGAGMEEWAEKVVSTLPKSVKTVCTSDGIVLNNSDPHVWLSFDNAKIQLKAICDTLSDVDTENAQKYTDRLNEYLAKIEILKYEYDNANLNGKTIYVTHGAYGYLCNDFGMTQSSLEGISGESDPSPSQMAEIVRDIKENNAKYIFYDVLESDKVAQAVAKEANIEALPISTFEGDADGRDYVTAMRDNLQSLKKIN